MKHIQTKTLYLMIIFILLLFIQTILLITNHINKDNKIFKSELLLKNDINQIQEIIISVPDNSNPPILKNITLTKSNGKFIFKTIIGEYEIKQSVIENLFFILSKKTNFRKITVNPNNFNHYGIDELSASKIILKNKNKSIITDLSFGNIDTLGTNIFIRTGNLNVYQTHDIYSQFLTLQPSFWIELQIYKNILHNTGGIQGIKINGKFIIRNKINNDNFNNFEHLLSSFTCIGIFQAPFTESISTKYIRVQLGNRNSVEIMYTPLDNGDYIFKDNRNTTTYIASGYAIRNLENIIDSF